jgi:hypothetical protein
VIRFATALCVGARGAESLCRNSRPRTLYVGPSQPTCCGAKSLVHPPRPQTSLQNESSTRPPRWRKRYYARQHTPDRCAIEVVPPPTRPLYSPPALAPTVPVCKLHSAIVPAALWRRCRVFVRLAATAEPTTGFAAEVIVVGQPPRRRQSQRRCHGELLALMHGPCIRHETLYHVLLVVDCVSRLTLHA